MAFCEIRSRELSIKIASLGAEIKEVTDQSLGHQWIWPSVDPWAKSAPILFPIVGKLKDDKYRYSGIEYRLSQHGFARDCDFYIVERADHRVVFRLESSDKTKSVYPFSFRLDVEYVVIGKSLVVAYHVRNDGAEDMLFNIGWHPAFVFPLQSDARGLQLEKCGVFEINHVLKDGLLFAETQKLEGVGDFVTLRRNTFERDALIFLNSKPGTVVLRDIAGNEIIIYCDEAPHLGLWTKDLAKFVCVEPWWGYADSAEVTGNIEDKPGVQALQPKGVWSGELKVQFGKSHES